MIFKIRIWKCNWKLLESSLWYSQL